MSPNKRANSSTISILRTIGSPFSPNREFLEKSREVEDLYDLAKRNKIDLLYLEALGDSKRPGSLQGEYEEHSRRWSDTQVTIERISTLLNLLDSKYAMFKTIKPFKATLNDTDILFFDSSAEFQEIFERIKDEGYITLGEAPHQVMVCDPRAGEEINKGKRGGVYYIDLYNEAAAGRFVYLDKRKLEKDVTEVRVKRNHKVRVLSPEADLLATIVHSIIPEQLYTIADYYTALFYLHRMNDNEISHFVRIVRENRATYAAKCFFEITLTLHIESHGARPQKLVRVLEDLQVETPEGRRLIESNYRTPHKYSIQTVLKVLQEKAKETRARRSIAKQCLVMFQPTTLVTVLKDLTERRMRETY